MPSRDRKSVRPFGVTSLVSAAVGLAVGALIVFLALRSNLFGGADDSESTPPPPSESVPTAPGPDNTITKAPPPPPPGMPSPPAENDESGDNPEKGRQQ